MTELLLAAQDGDHVALSAWIRRSQVLLADLESERRLAFVLTQILGLPYAEAAEICECPMGTIRSRVARARADLLDHLREAQSL